ncbi:unnamed protein product [Meganyctiphanes norvegica]|uniref:Homeobox domain-containing protein n=1 Tax=Meganyctiphanes norvegica TaxID=48144 RepID=A0AAV2PZH3_MEGNR
MFLSGGFPWGDMSTPGLGAPLGGLLSVLETAEGLQRVLLPTTVPRTAPCVVVSSTSPTSNNNNSSLKFGMDRLLAPNPEHRKDSTSTMTGSSNICLSVTASSLLTQTSSSAGLTSPASTPTSVSSPSSRLSMPSVRPPLSPLSPPCCPGGEKYKCVQDCNSPPHGTLHHPSHPYFYTPLYAQPPPPHHLLPYPALSYSGLMGHGGVLGRGDLLGPHGGGGGSGRRKRTWTRAVFSNLQRKGLEKRFHIQKYITKPDRRQLAATLGLTDAQVKVWFQNRRMKWRHAELKKREQQQQLQQQQQSQQQQQQSSSQERLQEGDHDIVDDDEGDLDREEELLVEEEEDDDDRDMEAHSTSLEDMEELTVV